MRRTLVASLLIFLSASAGCSRSSPPPKASPSTSPPPQFVPPAKPLAGSHRVHFPSAGGWLLDGRLFGSGPTGVVLTQAAFDQSDWFPGAGLLAEKGYRVLTFDVRGACPGGAAGCSKGEFDQFEVWRDVVGALRFMRGQPGIKDVVLMSAGFGAMSELQAAGKPGVVIDGLISIGAVEYGFGFNFTQEDIRRIGGAKLFIAGQLFEDAARSAQDFDSWARAPTEIKLVDSGEFGIDLLGSDQADVVWGSIIGFLARFPH